jgi:tetratricopeptide (TPR) repeat protein
VISQQQLDELWDFSDPAASEQRFRDAANADQSDAAEYLTQAARALGLQDRFDEAGSVLDGITDSQPVVAVRIELERGRIDNSAGRPEDAVPHFRAAASLAAEHGLGLLHIDALHMLAIADVDHEAEWIAQGVRAAEAATDDRTRRWLVALHNNHGWTLYDAGDVAGAITEFELALEAANSYGTPTQQQYAREALDEARQALDSGATA